MEMLQSMSYDYLVFYAVNEEERQIDIVRILPGRMDLARFFI